MDKLLSYLKRYYGEDAQYRDGQEKAIQDVLQGKRTLVVQKTGWGKSLVYFMATRLIRESTGGITFIISPLLALMNNQIESAAKLDLQVRTINSENSDEWNHIFDEIKADCVDALIISPERLANEEFKEVLTTRLSAQIGLFVVDEAHCISDWGHDFRPDYRRIVDIVRLLPPNIPVLATTATANNRVVEDIKTQLGGNLAISRGSLMRDSLSIQVIELASREERLAWLSKNIMAIPGTGIVYCLTIRDCELVYRWLKTKGILCECYHSKVEAEKKGIIVDRFMKNEIKVLIATVAFGMGFDKPEVRTFARQLAARLGLEYRDAIEKRVHLKYQKELKSAYLQYQNVNDSFEVREVEVLPENVLLVDDMVDSGWTFTVCGYKLREKGSGKVFPFALANTAGTNGGD